LDKKLDNKIRFNNLKEYKKYFANLYK